MMIIKKNWILIVLTISLLAVAFALTAEYIFKIYPCQMCLYQRYPYYAIIIISFLFLYNKWSQIIFLWISLILFIFGLFVSLWHVGIEQKILPALSSCEGKISSTQSITDLKNQILNQSVASCDEISWKILGISAASVNSLFF